MIQGFSGVSVNPPVMKETQVLSLGWEDLLEKEMATHSRILVWGHPMDRGARAGYSPMGCKESDMTEHAHINPGKW